MEEVDNFLNDHFRATSVLYTPPFVIINYDPDVTGPGWLPTTVGGLLPICRDDNNTNFKSHLGKIGCGKETYVDYRSWGKICRVEGPTASQLAELAGEFFSDCEALSFYDGTLIVELPLSTNEEFERKLMHLPSEYNGFPFLVEWHNGPLFANELRKRVITPNPSGYITKKDNQGITSKELKRQHNTDYLALENKIYPRVILTSLTDKGEADSHVSAGIIVRKGEEVRLTGSFHNWQDQYNKKPNLLGKDTPEAIAWYGATQGTPGTPIGYVRERIGLTDIVLIKMDGGIDFNNNFMEFEATAKKILPSVDIKRNDLFFMDGFTRGKQQLLARGRRVTFKTKVIQMPDGSNRPQKFQPQKHLDFEQGIYASTTPTMVRSDQPRLRARCCGSVLVRALKAGDRGPRKQTLMVGEVAKIFHWADGGDPDNAGYYLCTADSFDDLAKEGWSVWRDYEADDENQLEAGKEGQEKEAEAGTSSEEEESPRKRRRVA
ncbi:hypothetical protein QBC43DRAFT_218323 [Cladorrhinum sp. PSN259]|nr:hypothetical protein QBC43DRAFT_218323 [Cladorrhinum sp. PSN259]